MQRTIDSDARVMIRVRLPRTGLIEMIDHAYTRCQLLSTGPWFSQQFRDVFWGFLKSISGEILVVPFFAILFKIQPNED